jgi:hypothetical protein
MPNYWLGIMAVAFAGAMTVWIVLVFWAGRNIPKRPEDLPPPREIIGGVFEARRGGRQVMPDPREPIAHEDETGPGPAGSAGPAPAAPVSGTVPEQRKGPVPGTVVPEQRKASVPEQDPAAPDRPPARR